MTQSGQLNKKFTLLLANVLFIFHLPQVSRVKCSEAHVNHTTVCLKGSEGGKKIKEAGTTTRSHRVGHVGYLWNTKARLVKTGIHTAFIHSTLSELIYTEYWYFLHTSDSYQLRLLIKSYVVNCNSYVSFYVLPYAPINIVVEQNKVKLNNIVGLIHYLCISFWKTLIAKITK